MRESEVIQRHFCNNCRQHTRHTPLHSVQREYDIPDVHDSEVVDWTLWECLGCEMLLVTVEWRLGSEHDIEPSVSYLPERKKQQLAIKRFRRLPRDLRKLYEEVINAFNHQLFILCAGGVRSLLEAICTNISPEVAGPRVAFSQKLEVLKARVSENVVTNLGNFQFLGNQALHELRTPRKEELSLAIEVVEDVLNAIYDLDYKTSRLYQAIAATTQTSDPSSPGNPPA